MVRAKCWMCGTDKKVQKHHAIPKHLEPVKNTLIPLCDKCHKKVHDGLVIKNKREVLYFNKVKQPDGTFKMQSSISNGKVCFVDRLVKDKVLPMKKYDCLIKETDKVAFARDIKPIGKTGLIERIFGV